MLYIIVLLEPILLKITYPAKLQRSAESLQ